MSGLPFGAARQRNVPAEFMAYEGIAGIEYIEVDAERPCPRSVAYRRTSSGAQMRLRDNVPELVDLELTEGQARSYIDALVASGLFSWQRVYRPAQGTFVLASTQWRVEVSFAADGADKAPKSFRVEGENVFPDDYGQVVACLMAPGAAGAREASCVQEER